MKPPPCLACGSTRNYFTDGLCARCHRYGPDRVGSCRDCHAWGATRQLGWRCAACDGAQRRLPIGECVSCGRTLPVNERGGCRLCAKQRSRVIAEHPWPLPDLIEANRNGQQLFFADMGRFAHDPWRASPAIPMRSVGYPVRWRQQALFAWPWNLQARRHQGFVPPDPALTAWLISEVDDHAARHGWTMGHRDSVRYGVRVVLTNQATIGAAVRYSEVRLVAQLGVSVPGVAAVLSEARMLLDDRQASILGWFSRQIAELPPDMQTELDVWFDIMRHGSATAPRRLPRDDKTTYIQLRAALPAIRAWGISHQSLREITRADIYAALPASGGPRTLMIQGLRSIFRVLKGRQIVFDNPTARMRTHQPALAIPDPIDLPALRAAMDSDDPARAALAALLGYHAVRVSALRDLQLTDLRDGRLHVDDTVILLAQPALDRLARYLDHRARTWPNTINSHLFVNRRSATHTGPVNHEWVRQTLQMAPQAIRRDRILEEAFATGGDLRQLTDMFGVSVATANNYANFVHRARAAEHQPTGNR